MTGSTAILRCRSFAVRMNNFDEISPAHATIPYRSDDASFRRKAYQIGPQQ
jgi:hypothetical protein